MEASAELMSVALADGISSVADCTDEAPGGTANVTAYADGSPDVAPIGGPSRVVPAICATAPTSN